MAEGEGAYLNRPMMIRSMMTTTTKKSTEPDPLMATVPGPLAQAQLQPPASNMKCRP